VIDEAMKSKTVILFIDELGPPSGGAGRVQILNLRVDLSVRRSVISHCVEKLVTHLIIGSHLIEKNALFDHK